MKSFYRWLARLLMGRRQQEPAPIYQHLDPNDSYVLHDMGDEHLHPVHKVMGYLSAKDMETDDFFFDAGAFHQLIFNETNERTIKRLGTLPALLVYSHGLSIPSADSRERPSPERIVMHGFDEQLADDGFKVSLVEVVNHKEWLSEVEARRAAKQSILGIPQTLRIVQTCTGAEFIVRGPAAQAIHKYLDQYETNPGLISDRVRTYKKPTPPQPKF